nr:Chain B, Peptide ligand [synthetic construct]
HSKRPLPPLPSL